MACKLCGGNQAQFTSEMCIHFSGLENLDQPSVFAFPKILVCLGCGASAFTVPESDLALLQARAPTEKAAQLSDLVLQVHVISPG